MVWSAIRTAFGLRPPRTVATLTSRRKGSRPVVPPERWPPRPDWFEPPEELGVAAATRAILLQSDKLVVALVDCVAYSTGFEFAIAIRSRDGEGRLRGLFGPSSYAEESSFRVTITFPDGSLRSVGHFPASEAMEYYAAAQEGREIPAPAGPVVMQRSGSADERRAEFRYWCWPLPPDGMVKFGVEWKAAGVPFTEARVDASAIHRAGNESRNLWPDA